MAILRLSGSLQRRVYGKFPSVSINNTDSGIVEVHQPSVLSSDICYQVGSIDRQKRDQVVWCEERLLDKGKFPMVAINNNDPAIVVEVHEGRILRRIYCRVGILNGQYIDWELPKPKYLCFGRFPAVAIHENRVVVTFDSAHFTYTTHYCMGVINPDKTVNWKVTKGGLFSSGVTETSVTMNAEYVLAGGRGWTSIVYRFGQIQGDVARIEWLNEVRYNHIGYCPTISLDSDGCVIMAWQSLTLRRLSYVTGRVTQNGTSIKWGCATPYDYGYNPTIAISPNNGRVLEEHETNFAPRRCTLHYHTAILQKEAAAEAEQPEAEQPEAQVIPEREVAVLENGLEMEVIQQQPQ